nr:immunoglobulin light chain junction region [Macaca mulatta]
CMQTVDYPWTS